MSVFGLGLGGVPKAHLMMRIVREGEASCDSHESGQSLKDENDNDDDQEGSLTAPINVS